MPETVSLLRRYVGRPLRRTVRVFQSLPNRVRDLRSSTYASLNDVRIEVAPAGNQVPLFSAQFKESLAAIVPLLMEHRFDLLGSGWSSAAYGAPCRGLEGHRFEAAPVAIDAEGAWLAGRLNTANVADAQRVWRLIRQGYQPIDWQRDIKSGYRWNERTWYRDIRYGEVAGADVKMPWELARMQHLPLLAWAYAHPVARDTAERYVQEFRNQVLDFIATNPPRFGVNWTCTMDVAIRVANWLMAYHLLCAFGASFDAEFEAEFGSSIYDHARHIAAHLETVPFKGNHYLSGIAGLLFAAAHLSPTRECDDWLSFAARELIAEVESQFNPDGTNFEGSTSYHCLSTEIVLFSTALMLGPSPGRKAKLAEAIGNDSSAGTFSCEYTASLSKAIEFAKTVSTSDGEVQQLGDNDSGRFLKLEPHYDACVAEVDCRAGKGKNCWVEGPRNCASLLNAWSALSDSQQASGAESLDAWTVRLLSRRGHLGYRQTPRTPVRIEAISWDELMGRRDPIAPVQRRDYTLRSASCGLRNGLEHAAYPDFGLYVLRSPRLHLLFRCGSIGQKGFGGHAHDDQLSVDLTLDGRHLLADPGTYLYTPLPHRRNEYRSARAHNGPHPRGTGAELRGGLFSLHGCVEGECLVFAENQIAARVQWPSVTAYRAVEVRDDSVVIRDWIEGNFKGWEELVQIPHSPAYGVRESECTATLTEFAE